MKTHWTLIALIAAVGAFMAAAAWSQQALPEQTPTRPSTIPSPPTEMPPLPSITLANTIFDPAVASPTGVDGFPGASNVQILYSRIEQIIGRLRAADELHKPEIVKELEKAISEEFDADMKHREAELTKLEERVAKLRAQLERRKKAKADITQLQTKVLVNEIDGLGFSHPRLEQPAAIGIPGDATNADPFSPPPQRAVAPPPSTFPR